MKKYPFLAAVFLAFSAIAQAQDDAHEKEHGVKQDVKHAAHVVGQDIRQGAHHVAVAAKRAKNRVIVRCADGRHALRRADACSEHGGISKTATPAK